MTTVSAVAVDNLATYTNQRTECAMPSGFFMLKGSGKIRFNQGSTVFTLFTALASLCTPRLTALPFTSKCSTAAVTYMTVLGDLC